MPRIIKSIALSLAALLAAELILPTIVLALTSGPAQPEFGSFTAIGTSDMVDPFTGDLSYNIPLMDVDGYPVNLAYHSGGTMDEEASWVGSGWSLNMGVINRTMRGLPDDLDGDAVVKESNIKENRTWGVKAGYGFEIFGLKKKVRERKDSVGKGSIDFNLGIFNNSYTGYGFEFGASLGISGTSKGGMKGGLGLGQGYNSHEGISQSINASIAGQKKKADDAADKDAYSAGASGSASYNSRSGMKALALGVKANGSRTVQDTKTAVTGEESFNGNASIPTGTQSYTPQIQLPMKSVSGTLRITVGTAQKIGRNRHGSIEGYFSKQSLATHLQSNPAYGYFYSQDAGSKHALLDFNREKDGVFTEKTPNLPVSNFTYDIFTASGHGVSGMFRPFRGDIGVLSDPYQQSDGTGHAGGIEVGIGDLVHVGVNYSLSYSFSSSARWTADNAAAPFYRFRDRANAAIASYRPLHEIFYFKEAGEKTIGDPLFDAGVGGTESVRVRLNGQNATTTLENNSDRAVATTYNSRTQREKRQQVMTALTATEATTAGLRRTIDEYPLNGFDMSTGRYNIYASTNRINSFRKGHHLSEISVVKPDGARYVYGIPAYNVEQKDATFAVSGAGGDCSTGLVGYGGTDNSIVNTQGTDNYFDRTTTPAYAHAYLLTGVLSPDYADRTGDGISDDDPGTSVKLNYTRMHDDFKWRIPFGLNTASLSEGLKSNLNDNKGSYLFGRKEIWYAHSIETKTHVAEFYISPRHDGFGVTGENGGPDYSKPLYKLDSIRLFSKEDRIRNGANATPIKCVHLAYKYTICPGVPNNNTGGGKLTLDSVYFTYGNLPKGAVNAYQFKYSTVNPGYKFKEFDRWGNYKPNVSLTDCNDAGNSALRSANPDNPYVEQNKTTADQNASAWQLTEITLPSKGRISVVYESDDYAYTQNKRAMRMIPVIGVAENPTDGAIDANLFAENPGAFDGYRENTWLCFELPPDITSKRQLDERYLAGQADPLYFRFLVDITGKGDYEYVNGYAHVEESRVTNGPNGAINTRGWLLLERTTLRDKQPSDYAHPIAKAAWQLARLQMASKIFAGSDPEGEGESAIKGLLGYMQDMRIMYTGFNRTLRGRGFGQKFVPNKSTIRLVEPSRRRLGGGIRVRRIESSDEWQAMGGATARNATYGQEFTYTMSGNESADETSSGVASYEPMVGGDENPFRQPVKFTVKHFLAPDDYNYQEGPFGESHFPDPSVGYRRVTIRDIHHDAGNVTQYTATGKAVHEFYTALDFPVRATQADIRLSRTRPKFLDKLFRARSLDYLAVSQGYAIEKNDMHGKPKAQWTYAEGGTAPISGVEYFYRTEPGDATRLNSTVPVIDKAGNVRQAIVGRDIDVTLDMRQTTSNSVTSDIAANVDVWTIPVPIAIAPTLWGKTTVESTRFRSSVITKAIYAYGILDSVVAHEDGARVSTANVARDAETGEVLLTRTSNTFRDPVYNFTYPAHWAYDGMGPACRNVGARLDNVAIDATGRFTLSSVSLYLVRGDEVLLRGSGSSRMVAWVIGTSGNDALLVDRSGVRIPAGTYSLLVTRSGRRNQQSSPIGTVSSLEDPIASGRIAAFTKVLNAESIEYSDIWRTTCGVAKMQMTDSITCSAPTSAANKFAAVLNEVALQGKLLTAFQLDATTIPPYYSSLFDSPPHSWVPNLTAASPPSTTFVPSIKSWQSPIDKRCQLTLVAPMPIDWNDVKGFGPIASDPGAVVTGVIHTFTIEAILSNGSRVMLHGVIPCVAIAECRGKQGTLSECGTRPGGVINPFIYGLWGNWRRSRSYAYLVDRNPVSTSSGVSTRYDGAYAGFTPFWSPPTSGLWRITPAGWKWTAQVTRFDADGFELENQDALGRFSGALYGYLNTLPMAVASNARYRSIAFDGFEDYYTAGLGRRCPVPRHWDFANSLANATLDDQVSHTGDYSLRLGSGNSATVTRTIEADCRPTGYLTASDRRVDDMMLVGDPPSSASGSASRPPVVVPSPPTSGGSGSGARRPSPLPPSSGGAGSGGRSPIGSSAPAAATLAPVRPPVARAIPLTEYMLQPCDCNGLFSPEPNRTYVFSGWVRESIAPPLYNTGRAEVTIDIAGANPSSITFTPSGLIVEGWRRVEGTFPIGAGATGITVTLKNGSGAPGPAWFDDIRIHPFDATMKTYVFDPVTLRQMAILDERNYASIYEYNYEGQLTRLKKETERGIGTVQEHRSELRKQ